MTDKKISDLASLTAVAGGDLLELADVSDTTDSAQGSSKQATVASVATAPLSVNTVAATGATETLDTTAFDTHDCTMDQNCTFTFSNPGASGTRTAFVLILRGAFTPTLPASVDWGDATPPTYATPSVYTFVTVDGGTTWLGAQVGKAFA